MTAKIDSTSNSLYPQATTALEPHNATLITPRGVRISVNITPEAATVWMRFGFKIEWLIALESGVIHAA